ncbi:MAG: hypothetical protein U0984_08895, partial [Prosthecobacter sp.]|nr:hypothetical protein [Prosthecobacter sp.]
MKTCLGILLLLAAAVWADEPRDIAFTAKVDGTEQRYVELLPPGYSPDKTNDVLIVFHGHGADRWQFIKDARGECKGVRDVAAKFG